MENIQSLTPLLAALDVARERVGHAAAQPTCDERRHNRVNSGSRGATPAGDAKTTDDQPEGRSSLVVGTGVDPVTFRFSGGRSAN